MARAVHPIETLTDREREILRLMADGKTNPEIAEAMGIRFETAKWYVSEVLQKFQVPTREAAAAEYRRYHRWRARAGRALAAIPQFTRWAAGGAVLVAAGLIVLIAVAAVTNETGSEPQWLVAYVVQDWHESNPAPEPIHIVDARTGETRDFGPHRLYAAVAWSPRGNRLLALTTDGELLLFSYPEGDMLPVSNPDISQFVGGHTAGRLRPVWSPDGSQFAVDDRIYDANGKIERKFDTGLQSALVWSPDGSYYSVAYDDALFAFDRNHNLRFEHRGLPRDPESDAPIAVPIWFSDNELAIVVDESVAGGPAGTTVDVSVPSPELGPLEPSGRLLGRMQSRIERFLEGPEQTIVADGHEVRWGDYSERPLLGIIDGSVQASPAPRRYQQRLAVTDGKEVRYVDATVRWVIPGTIGPWGPRADAVIID